MHAHTGVLCVLKLFIGPETEVFSNIGVTLQDFNSSSRHSKVLRSCIKYSTSLDLKIQLNTIIRQYTLCYFFIISFPSYLCSDRTIISRQNRREIIIVIYNHIPPEVITTLT
jgi:hypothetical protein